MTLPAMMIGHSSKSYATLADTRAWVAEVVGELRGSPRSGDGIFLCTPDPVISIAGNGLDEIGAQVGAQDVSPFGLGAFTGETAAEVLSEVGATLVMVGHPERAKLLGETLADVRQKCRAASDAGVVPILIAGEPERGEAARSIIDRQLTEAFADVPGDRPIVVAYEPSWAIGQPEPAPGDYVAATIAHIRGQLAGRSGDVRILYGGSAGPGTFAAIWDAAEELGAGHPDGVFLGRFGLRAAGFLETVREVRAVQDQLVIDAPRIDRG
ncbi:triose-phosphate isomerase [Pseudoclavibacter sp. RFBI5]|uniref:triose-phosphate isomerase family protein n=1 Tax=Pseudoclavibacter sp. RFBI5 TaxID=2080578 RepID=UPI000CE865B8|nr:triose-phosphate isomerase family protein [Pseudoclavibacter sp. RFBI5]PPG04954.1 triose-phosphate isomerase [Pseudoclavibacter sp. RFBI5]